MNGSDLVRMIVATALLFIGPGVASAHERPDPDLLVLQNVNVIDVANGAVEPSMSVEISNGRIKSIYKYDGGKRLAVNAKSLDLTGLYLMPGFVEMHAHLLLHSWDDAGNIKPRFDRAEVEKMLRLLLAYGITTVRDPGSETEAAVAFRAAVEKEDLIGPQILTAGRMLNTGTFNAEPFVLVRGEQDIRDEIRWQAAGGVDFIKVYSGMPPEFVRIAIDEAHKHGLKVIGHLQATSWTQAAELGIDGICHSAPWSPDYLSPTDRPGYEQTIWGRVYWLEHLDLKSQGITSMADSLARHHQAVDPTLIAMHTKFFGNSPIYTRSPQLKLFDSPARGWPKGSFTASWTDERYSLAQKQWPKVLDLTKLLFDHDVLLTVGTDTPSPWIIPGVSYHQELQLLSDAGISDKAIIKMATINGAVALGREKEFGQVKPGLLANLVVVRADPLSNIQNLGKIEYVFKKGRVFKQNELLENRK